MFYDKFLELCKKKGVKPTPAAIDAGISKSLVTKWRTMKIEIPSPEVLAKISQYFNGPISELLSEEELPETEQKNISPSEQLLTEGEKELIELFRLIPEDQQKVFLGMVRSYANSLKAE